MSTINEKKEARQKITNFLEEIRVQLSLFSNKKYSSKSEIDKDIFEQKKLVAKINEVVDNKFVTNAQLNALFDEQDALYEKLDSLRKESRRILNEQSGIEIVSDANVSKCCSLSLGRF